jgi:CheY-like chemotaxis protein
MESIGTLAGGIAHDFNNILAAITGNAKLALADLTSAHPLHAHLREIEKAGLRAGDLVRQILTFSRRQEAQRRVIHLREIVAEALRLLRATIPAQIEIRTHYDERTPPIEADATQIHQAVVNLGANAAHAMRESGGVLSVRVEPFVISSSVDAAENDIPSTLAPGNYARLIVSDTGSGMEPGTLGRIFEPFFTTKAAGQGTGLGLSVVHGIMRSHDGAIAVQSAPGAGSTFYLYFPQAREQVDTASTMPALRTVAGSGQRILYVDDEEALVFLATRVLERLGYEVTGRTDAKQALADFRADPTKFDAVISDLSMPGMTGPELARALLAIRSDLPIVLTSGYLRDEDTKLARELGIRDLVLKPNTVDGLGEALHRVLSTNNR